MRPRQSNELSHWAEAVLVAMCREQAEEGRAVQVEVGGGGGTPLERVRPSAWVTVPPGSRAGDGSHGCGEPPGHKRLSFLAMSFLLWGALWLCYLSRSQGVL